MPAMVRMMLGAIIWVISSLPEPAFAEGKPAGYVRPSRAPGPTEIPAPADRSAGTPSTGVVHPQTRTEPSRPACHKENVCRDARPLGDRGPPRPICEIRTVCNPSPVR